MDNIQELIEHLENEDRSFCKINKIKGTTFEAEMVDGYYIGLKYAVIRQHGTYYRVDLDTAQIISYWND